MGYRSSRFGARLSMLLEEHGLNNKQFAEAIEISQNSVTNYIRKGRLPEPDILIAMSLYFKKSIDWLLQDVFEELSGKPYTPDGDNRNRTEESLVKLLILAQLPQKQGGWHQSLALWLNLEINVVQSWVEDDRIPAAAVKQIEARGFPADRWLLEKPPKPNPAYESFVKLAALLGLSTKHQRIPALSKALGLDDIELVACLQSRKITPAIVEAIEARGYPRTEWLYTEPAPANAPVLPDKGNLLKKADEVLSSGTHFGKSLAMNIHSFHDGLKTSKRLADLEKDPDKK